MRVTQQGLASNVIRNLDRRFTDYANTQERLSSGRRMQRPSDDPAGMTRALGLRTDLARVEQQVRNADDAMGMVDIADSKLQGATSLLQRVRELAIRAANAPSVSESAAIVKELQQVKQELVSIANSRSEGRPIFAGFQAGEAVASVSGVWTYQGDAGAFTRRVSDSEPVEVSVTAAQVFGFNDGDDVFTMLDGLEANVSAGDSGAISSNLDDIDNAMGRVLDGLAELGGASNRIDAARERSLEEIYSVRAELAEVEDVDLAEGIMDLQLQEIAYQAALGAVGRVLQPSLVNFLS